MRYEPAVKGILVPEVSKRFLFEAGLPRQAGLDLQFDLAVNKLLTLPKALKEENLSAVFDRYRPIWCRHPNNHLFR